MAGTVRASLQAWFVTDFSHVERVIGTALGGAGAGTGRIERVRLDKVPAVEHHLRLVTGGATDIVEDPPATVQHRKLGQNYGGGHMSG